MEIWRLVTSIYFYTYTNVYDFKDYAKIIAVRRFMSSLLQAELKHKHVCSMCWTSKVMGRLLQALQEGWSSYVTWAGPSVGLELVCRGFCVWVFFLLVCVCVHVFMSCWCVSIDVYCITGLPKPGDRGKWSHTCPEEFPFWCSPGGYRVVCVCVRVITHAVSGQLW